MFELKTKFNHLDTVDPDISEGNTSEGESTCHSNGTLIPEKGKTLNGLTVVPVEDHNHVPSPKPYQVNISDSIAFAGLIFNSNSFEFSILSVANTVSPVLIFKLSICLDR